MLLLTRKVGEIINIGENVVLKVLNIGHKSITLGIDAPKEVKIWRNEIWKKQMEKEAQHAELLKNTACQSGR